MAYICRMVIIETSIFTKLINQLMSDDQYRELQEALVNRPELGDIIKGSGGLRKVRWKLESTGKSGGVRVIYYWVVDDNHIRMLYVYPKGKQENLTSEQLNALKTIIERW
ncbi:MAG: type II toxin-antitoxin system RelE/ParE family toxin [Oleiphilus sp.]